MGTDRIRRLRHGAAACEFGRGLLTRLDCSPAFERHRRYQSARHRELLRTLETLRKMRKEEFGTGNGESEMADGKSQMADGKCQMADGKCQMADGKCQMADDGCQTGNDSGE